MDTAAEFVLFGTAGWSNCLRTKEFLSDKGVDFIAINVESDPKARERLLQLGVRYTPTVVKGERYVLANNLEAVARFVGVHGPGHTLLPPEALVRKWLKILRAAQRYVRQIPDNQMAVNATQGRGRSIRHLEHHVFNIAEGLLGCASGARNVKELTGKRAADGKLTTGEEMAQYGGEIIARIEQWWNGLVDKSCQQKLETTDYGVISLHQLLDRSTWHSTHHARQIADVLERLGIEPDGRLTDEDFAGLLLPERVWD